MTRRRQRSPRARAEQQTLPEAELEVLARLHRLGEAEASELRDALEPTRPMAHASVVTLLSRLRCKGLVTRRKAEVGKAFVYRATRDPEETFGEAVGRLLDRVFAGDAVALVASLFGGRPPSDRELERLEQLVDELHRRTGEEGG